MKIMRHFDEGNNTSRPVIHVYPSGVGGVQDNMKTRYWALVRHADSMLTRSVAENEGMF